MVSQDISYNNPVFDEQQFLLEETTIRASQEEETDHSEEQDPVFSEIADSQNTNENSEAVWFSNSQYQQPDTSSVNADLCDNVNPDSPFFLNVNIHSQV